MHFITSLACETYLSASAFAINSCQRRWFLILLKNKSKLTVQSSKYEYCTICYPLIRCWCHFLRLQNLKLSSIFCSRLKRTSCGYEMYPQQTWRINSLWRHNNFQQPMKTLLIFSGCTCVTHVKTPFFNSVFQTSIYWNNFFKNLLFNLFHAIVIILPIPLIFITNVYLTCNYYKNTIYSWRKFEGAKAKERYYYRSFAFAT